LEQPLISVITPLFNRVQYIEDTVKSVLSQNYRNIEYLIVDDGSTDGSYEWVRGLDDERVRVYCHPDRMNRGQSAALNLGIAHSKGSYVVLLDSDDTLADGMLKCHLDYLLSHPRVGMVYGKGLAISADGEPLFETLPEGHQEPSDPNRLLMDCYLAMPGSAMVRRDVYERVGGFEERYRAAQDHDMALRIMEVAKVAYVPEVTFYYRKHAGSISVNGLERRWKIGFEILRSAEERYPYKKCTVRKRRAVLYFRLAQTYWGSSRKLKAVPNLVMSGVLDPLRALRVITRQERI